MAQLVREDLAIGNAIAPPAKQIISVQSQASWMRPHTIGKPRLTGAHGLAWYAWTGDRARGWTGYCLCGFCTPMKRSYDEMFDALETHWSKAA